MSDSFFLDTNLFVYVFDPHAKGKAVQAERLIRNGIGTGKGIVSYQVVQEFYNVAFKKFVPPMSNEEAHAYFASVFRPLLGVMFSSALLLRAMGIREKVKIAWYDALIVAAAIESKCKTLYSEDLEHESEIEGVRIRNPFLLTN